MREPEVTILTGDCLDSLRSLPAGSVHCCMTSPPYYSLRDYGVAGQIGLEDSPTAYVAALVDVFREVRRVLRDDGTLWLNLGDSYGPGKQLAGMPWRVAFALRENGWTLRQEIIWAKPNPMPESVSDRCTKAHESLFLFAKTPGSASSSRFASVSDSDARWVAGLIDCEGSIVVKRGRHDGRADTFAPQVSIGSTCRRLLERVAAIFGHGNILERPGKNAPMHYWQVANQIGAEFLRRVYPFLVVKQRQARIGIHVSTLTHYRGGKRPERKQRSASEHDVLVSLWERNKACNHFGDPDLSDVPEPDLFLLAKSPRYYFDAEAIKEPAAEPRARARSRSGKDAAARDTDIMRTRVAGSVGSAETRNRRSVWNIAPKPYKGAHFACFPPALVEPCVLAGTSARGCCPHCGAGYVRRVERQRVATRPESAPDRKVNAVGGRGGLVVGNRDPERHVTRTETVGWDKPCACPDAEPVPAVVLDPFGGSGTTAEVAVSHGRDAVLCELNPEYVKLIYARLGVAYEEPVA